MESKELNLVEILKDCPKGTKLWSPICGECELREVKVGIVKYPIAVIFQRYDDETLCEFTSNGHYFIDVDSAECMLFPSKDNRDWSMFKAPKPKWNPDTLKPFDKVIVRDDEGYKWRGDFFLCKDEAMPDFPYTCIRTMYKYCIPYNEETKHLLGTSDEEPEYYRL
jgi:hypothetical protein